ncbi:hypothetical protein B0T20DRAFT_467188 [Sordaria brevicollis]|uniref:Uncharacterized protein n=1 Tax=Sordaria brevicollis TaxID=83679 RepID=A0AAE0PLP2_SORBR|nr:hypothetical protein B0T20DRAFT_467188 [Sordaria brevicollis]
MVLVTLGLKVIIETERCFIVAIDHVEDPPEVLATMPDIRPKRRKNKKKNNALCRRKIYPPGPYVPDDNDDTNTGIEPVHSGPVIISCAQPSRPLSLSSYGLYEVIQIDRSLALHLMGKVVDLANKRHVSPRADLLAYNFGLGMRYGISHALPRVTGPDGLKAEGSGRYGRTRRYPRYHQPAPKIRGSQFLSPTQTGREGTSALREKRSLGEPVRWAKKWLRRSSMPPSKEALLSPRSPRVFIVLSMQPIHVWLNDLWIFVHKTILYDFNFVDSAQRTAFLNALMDRLISDEPWGFENEHQMFNLFFLAHFASPSRTQRSSCVTTSIRRTRSCSATFRSTRPPCPRGEVFVRAASGSFKGCEVSHRKLGSLGGRNY